eukprot:CAMPEP_0184499668 /NCGR_PEP_ID=MMETSP0113_2-20130426/42175_1 /TAXON_ID=91329 /ORGANISM="Norrisiella sphaerica, Strain BC52" /LENGTH=68 /DNA_ID=CAMNT_0026887667 /DNA_START=112 /DNA_END=315 /DNA_ORIENTATION=-
MTSYCFFRCFYTTLLGEESGTKWPSKGGMTRVAIKNTWEAAFDGCPPASTAVADHDHEMNANDDDDDD